MLLLVAALLSSMNPVELSSDDVDHELATFFANARGGFLLHRLTHYTCDNTIRQHQNDEMFAEYEQLERDYERLGGKFLPDDQQPIFEEAAHYHCAGDPLHADEEWQKSAAAIEIELSAAKRFLAEKKKRQRHHRLGVDRD